MGFLEPVELTDADKLDVLQRLDRFRPWRSLDEQRVCRCCGKVVTGHSILVVGGSRGNGPLRIVCPTPRCNAIPMDWLRPDGVVSFAIESPVLDGHDHDGDGDGNHDGDGDGKHDRHYGTTWECRR